MTKVINPTMSFQQDIYDNKKQYVTINSQTSGTTIYYTLDGSNPNNSSFLYTSPFMITIPLLIKTIAKKSLYSDSDIVEGRNISYDYNKVKIFDFCMFKKNPSLSENLNVNKLTYQIEFDSIIEV